MLERRNEPTPAGVEPGGQGGWIESGVERFATIDDASIRRRIHLSSGPLQPSRYDAFHPPPFWSPSAGPVFPSPTRIIVASPQWIRTMTALNELRRDWDIRFREHLRFFLPSTTNYVVRVVPNGFWKCYNVLNCFYFYCYYVGWERTGLMSAALMASVTGIIDRGFPNSYLFRTWTTSLQDSSGEIEAGSAAKHKYW